MRSSLGWVVLLVPSLAAASPKLPADVPLPAHAKVVSVEDGRPHHAAFTWKAMLAVDCKAKPVIAERARLDKRYTVKATAADAVLSLYAATLTAEKRTVTPPGAPPSRMDFLMPPSVVFAQVAKTTDGCGPQIELSIGPAGG